MAINKRNPDDECWVCGEPAHVRKYRLCGGHYRKYLRKMLPINSRVAIDFEKSLAARYPHLLHEWNYDKNGSLSPDFVYPYSEITAYWICEHKHEYGMKIASKVAGNGCPICTGRQLTFERSLANLFPEVAAEWDFEKNGDLTPADVHAKKKLKVYWLCSEKRHSFEASIDNRTNRKSGCPYCRGLKVCLDNCLATIYPELAIKWHPTKNGELTPFDVTSSSSQPVTWLCRATRIHEWTATVNQRRGGASKCPYCYGRRQWTEEGNRKDVDWKLAYRDWYNGMVSKKLSELSTKESTLEDTRSSIRLYL